MLSPLSNNLSAGEQAAFAPPGNRLSSSIPTPPRLFALPNQPRAALFTPTRVSLPARYYG